MKITDIKVLPVDNDEKLKAYITITLDNCFIIRDIKIITGPRGYFISMPSKKMKNGTYRDLFHPTNKLTRIFLETVIIAEYKKIIKK